MANGQGSIMTDAERREREVLVFNIMKAFDESMDRKSSLRTAKWAVAVTALASATAIATAAFTFVKWYEGQGANDPVVERSIGGRGIPVDTPQ